MSLMRMIRAQLGLMSGGNESQNHFFDGSVPNQLTLKRGVPDAPGATVMQVVDGSVSFPNSGAFSLRNKLINGDMRIAQRGVSITAVANAVTYVLDRWAMYVVGANLVTQKFADSEGNATLQINGAAGNTVANVVQRIEAANSYFLSTQFVTVSFIITSPNARNITVGLSTPNASDAFSGAVTNLGANTVSVPAGISKVVTTFDLPQNVINGLELGIQLGAHTSGVFYVTKVQLEEGAVATPFEQRPIGLELSLCQRYYQVVKLRSCGVGAGVAYINATSVPHVPFRGTPTGIVYDNAGNANAVSADAANNIPAGAILEANMIGWQVNNYVIPLNNVALGTVKASAEL